MGVRKNGPQRLKPGRYGARYGTTEVVPSQKQRCGGGFVGGGGGRTETSGGDHEREAGDGV